MRARALRVGDHILRQFPADTSETLVEFAKYISRIDADYIIFMARKALRLYDLLLVAGAPAASVPIISNHILEQDPSYFCGKHIALIDDTLILGTTLGEARRTLITAGASKVDIYVFAVDVENWCKDVVYPTHHFAEFSHADLLTFCTDEVSALALAGIPYLSEFPLTKRTRFIGRNFTALHSLPNWDTHYLTSPRQELSGAFYYSVLPRSETLESFKFSVGSTIGSLIDICKLRLFTRRSAGTTLVTLAPIVTFLPIYSSDIDVIFNATISNIETLANQKLQLIRESIRTPKSKLRAIQYIVSLLLGQLFFSELLPYTDLKAAPSFDLSEAVRLFGPWLRKDFQIIHRAIGSQNSTIPHPKEWNQPNIESAPLPEEVAKVSSRDYIAFVRERFIENETYPHATGVFTDLERAFIKLHRVYELPARNETRRLGDSVFEVESAAAPYRDRLKYGFAWIALAHCLLENEGVSLNTHRSNSLSLLLDPLIDMGIAVPVLCEKDGVLFRGYRYGEDVQFGDQEQALAYDAAAGFLAAADRPDIPRLVLEKLLVALIRVGVSRGFLSVVHGIGGTDGIARVGFHLHGAVPMLPKSDTIFADDQDSWLSRSLLDNGVLKTNQSGRFELGERPDAAFVSRNSSPDARKLGLMLGTLFASRESNGTPILDNDSLVILTSCGRPRDSACAIAAELRLLFRWLGRNKRALSTPLGKERGDVVARENLIVQSQGYTALHSARLKVVGHFQNRAVEIAENCATFLAQQAGGQFLEAEWRGDWSSILTSATIEEKLRFDPFIESLRAEVLNVALGVFSMELAIGAIRAQSGKPNDISHFDAVRRKISAYLAAFGEPKNLVKRERTLRQRLTSLAEDWTAVSDLAEMYTFGLNWALGRQVAGSALVDQVLSAVGTFGRMEKRYDFPYCVWYDIVDSTGEKSALNDLSLKNYRNKVREFKSHLNQIVMNISNEARSQGEVVYPWGSPIYSKDDEKHIFVSGKRAADRADYIVRLLLNAANNFNLRIRVVAINGDFAGEQPFRFVTDPHVDGERFWEHLSRIKKRLRQIENEYELGNCSFLWLADELSTREGDALDLISRSSEARQHEIITEIEEFEVSTMVFGGPVEAVSK